MIVLTVVSIPSNSSSSLHQRRSCCVAPIPCWDAWRRSSFQRRCGSVPLEPRPFWAPEMLKTQGKTGGWLEFHLENPWWLNQVEPLESGGFTKSFWCKKIGGWGKIPEHESLGVEAPVQKSLVAWATIGKKSRHQNHENESALRWVFYCNSRIPRGTVSFMIRLAWHRSPWLDVVTTDQCWW